MPAQSVSAGPGLVAVQHDVVSLGDHAFELHVLARELGGHADEVIDEGLFAVADVGIVLDVHVAGVERDRIGGTALVEHQIVESGDGLLVALEIGGHGVTLH
jgi:hypothetical protein